MSTTGQSQSDLANMTVEELEKALREHPEDRDIKYELLYALVFRHFERVGAHDRGADADLARIREFAVELGDGPAYANAYLAHLDNEPTTFASCQVV
ncbi:MAG: hypothetical protein FJZ90_04270 [Chloroflexi bacterium]|nr:hypothetical protein [Chloroflexota bacterium]